MTYSPRPDWHYAAGIGPAWHGLEMLGAKDPAEIQRMGFDVVYFEGAPAGAEPVVDVYAARVVFPAAARPGVGVRFTSAPAHLSALRPTSDLAWPFTWPAHLADARRQGRIEVRRLANQARARLGLLSSDDEDNIERTGGRVHGAVAYDRRGRPTAIGSASIALQPPPGGPGRFAGVEPGSLRYKGKL